MLLTDADCVLETERDCTFWCDLSSGFHNRKENIMALFPGIGDMINYSTDEQIIGTWTDGSPVYRKVYRPNVTINTTTKSTYIDTSLTMSNVKCIKMYGNFTDGSSQNSSADFHYWAGSSDIGYSCLLNGTGLLFQTWNHNWTCRELVVEYIKI